MDKYIKLLDTFKKETELLQKLKKSAEKNVSKAKKDLVKNIDRLWSKLFPDLPFFKTAAEALRDLVDRGYKIKHTKLYEDIKTGKLTVQKDRKIFKADLDSYILSEELKKESEDTEEQLAELKDKTGLKTSKQIDLLDKQIKNLETDINIKTDQWIPRDEVIKAWVNRVSEIRSGLLAQKNRLSPLLVGKSQKQISAIIEKENKALLNNFTRTGRFTPKEKKGG